MNKYIIITNYWSIVFPIQHIIYLQFGRMIQNTIINLNTYTIRNVANPKEKKRKCFQIE